MKKVCKSSILSILVIPYCETHGGLDNQRAQAHPFRMVEAAFTIAAIVIGIYLALVIVGCFISFVFEILAAPFEIAAQVKRFIAWLRTEE